MFLQPLGRWAVYNTSTIPRSKPLRKYLVRNVHDMITEIGSSTGSTDGPEIIADAQTGVDMVLRSTTPVLT